MWPFRKKTNGEKFTIAVNKTAKTTRKEVEKAGKIIYNERFSLALLFFSLVDLSYYGPFMMFKIESFVNTIILKKPYDLNSIWHEFTDFGNPIVVLALSAMVLHTIFKDFHKSNILLHHIENKLETKKWGALSIFFGKAPGSEAKKSKSEHPELNIVINFLVENPYLAFSTTLIVLYYFGVTLPFWISLGWFFVNLGYDVFNQFESLEPATGKKINIIDNIGSVFKSWIVTGPKRLEYLLYAPFAFLPWYIWFVNVDYEKFPVFYTYIVSGVSILISAIVFFKCKFIKIEEVRRNKNIFDEALKEESEEKDKQKKGDK